MKFFYPKKKRKRKNEFPFLDYSVYSSTQIFNDKSWKKCTASLFKPSFMLPSSFSDSNLSRSYLYSRDFGKTPFIPDRSHNFPPILMEHRRGHVSSTFHGALINPDIVDLPFPHIHDFLPESGRERVSSPDFWLKIRTAAGKTRKQTRGNWIVKGVVVPRIYRVRRPRFAPRFPIIYRRRA